MENQLPTSWPDTQTRGSQLHFVCPLGTRCLQAALWPLSSQGSPGCLFLSRAHGGVCLSSGRPGDEQAPLKCNRTRNVDLLDLFSHLAQPLGFGRCWVTPCRVILGSMARMENGGAHPSLHTSARSHTRLHPTLTLSPLSPSWRDVIIHPSFHFSAPTHILTTAVFTIPWFNPISDILQPRPLLLEC